MSTRKRPNFASCLGFLSSNRRFACIPLTAEQGSMQLSNVSYGTCLHETSHNSCFCFFSQDNRFCWNDSFSPTVKWLNKRLYGSGASFILARWYLAGACWKCNRSSLKKSCCNKPLSKDLIVLWQRVPIRLYCSLFGNLLKSFLIQRGKCRVVINSKEGFKGTTKLCETWRDLLKFLVFSLVTFPLLPYWRTPSASMAYTFLFSGEGCIVIRCEMSLPAGNYIHISSFRVPPCFLRFFFQARWQRKTGSSI